MQIIRSIFLSNPPPRAALKTPIETGSFICISICIAAAILETAHVMLSC